jgi:transcriptional regulator with XRE-family HTH domain
MTNAALIATRTALGLSQEEFAAALRGAGVPGCTQRQVARWEAGQVQRPQAHCARALMQLTGQPLEALGFKPPKGKASPDDGGMGRREVLAMGALLAMPIPDGPDVGKGRFEGIWVSEYRYVSSSRDNTSFKCSHFVVVAHRGQMMRVRSLPGTANGMITMELRVKGSVVTGNWEERTDQGGYYQGKVYFGAIQMTADPTGTRLTGKWLGFGNENEINDGPWKLSFLAADTGRASLERYNRPVVAKTPAGDDAVN